MDDFQTEMNRVVQQFVAQISELAKRAAFEQLAEAFQASGTGGGSGGRGRGRSAGQPSFGGGARGRGAKRSADELDQLSEAFVGYVKDNPGLRIEQINKELGTTTKDLALPIRKLVAEGAVHTKGAKRSTTYFAGEGGRRRKKG